MNVYYKRLKQEQIVNLTYSGLSEEMAKRKPSKAKKFEEAVADVLENTPEVTVTIESQGTCYECKELEQDCECKVRYCPDIYGTVTYQEKKGGWHVPFVADCKYYDEDTSLSRNDCKKIVRDKEQMMAKLKKEAKAKSQAAKIADKLKGLIILKPGKISERNQKYLDQHGIQVIVVAYKQPYWITKLQEDFEKYFP